jgi:hypothetical protein
MSAYNPSEAPLVGSSSTARTEYEVRLAWSFYGEPKGRTWAFPTLDAARDKVRELLRDFGAEYVWLVRVDETSLPLVEAVAS